MIETKYSFQSLEYYQSQFFVFVFGGSYQWVRIKAVPDICKSLQFIYAYTSQNLNGENAVYKFCFSCYTDNFCGKRVTEKM